MPLSSTTVSRAYENIKERIITLDLQPGSAIHESALAEELQMGRTPVREALKLLQAEKLVTTVSSRGMFVSNVSITDLQQIAEIRVEMEGLSARLAAERATLDEVLYLEELCDQAEEARDGYPRQVIHLDRRLHTAIAAASHNEYLISEVERFYCLSLRLWHLALARVQTADLDMQIHHQLLDAIRSRNPELAESLMRQHIRNFQSAIRAAM